MACPGRPVPGNRVTQQKQALLACVRNIQHPEGFWLALGARVAWNDDSSSAGDWKRALARDFGRALGVDLVVQDHARDLFKALANCDDPLPKWASRKLGLAARATYGTACRLLCKGTRLQTRPVVGGKRPTRPTELRGLRYAEAVRWLSHESGRKCRGCGEPLAPQGKTGRPRRYHGGACRARAFRDRHRVR